MLTVELRLRWPPYSVEKARCAVLESTLVKTQRLHGN